MASKLTGTIFAIGYSNSNGSRSGRLKEYVPDNDFPMGVDTPITERKYLLDLKTPYEFCKSPDGEFPPHSMISLDIDITGNTNQTLDPSTVLNIPCRQLILDDGSVTEKMLTIGDFVDFSSPVVLLPGKGKNTFYYKLSSIEVIRIGAPSASPSNMNNSVVLIAPMKA